MRIRSVAAALATVATFAACKASDLNIGNPNAATGAGAAADPRAVQLLATGLLADMRGNTSSFAQPSGILGRESYTFTPTEGRNTTHYLIGISVAGTPRTMSAASFALVSAAWAIGTVTERSTKSEIPPAWVVARRASLGRASFPLRRLGQRGR